MPAGTSAPASSDVLGLLNTKPQNTPPTMGGGNWLTVGSWNKPPTGQSLTDWNSWLGKIGVPQNTFGQFLINPVTGQYSLPTNQNLQGGIGSKPAYQTFPLYNQPTTPTTNTPTTTTPPPSIYTPDMPNYVGGEQQPIFSNYTPPPPTPFPTDFSWNTPLGTNIPGYGTLTGWNSGHPVFGGDMVSNWQGKPNTPFSISPEIQKLNDAWTKENAWKYSYTPNPKPPTTGTTTAPTTTTPTTTTPKTTTPTTFSNPNQQAWLNYATRAGYNPSRLMSYYNRRNQRIQ